MGLKKSPRLLILTLVYTALVQVAYGAALVLRFEGQVPSALWHGWLLAAPAFTVLSLIGFWFAGLYHGLWRYASTVTLFQIVKGVTLSAASLALVALFSPRPLFPPGLVVGVWLWELVLMGGVRFAWRLSRERILGPMPLRAGRALVVGAGHAGMHLIQEMRRGPAGQEVLYPTGIIDDDQRLTGQLVEGVKVFGTIADLPRVLREQRIEMVIVSEPSMPAKVVREIARCCADAQVRVKTLPGLSDLQQGRTALSQMRDVRIDDLLGRQPVHLHLDEVAEFLRHERVLVTGGGGSIGSELARQIATFDPASLVLLDHAENGLYFVHNELGAQHPELPIHAVVADIQDTEGIERVFARFRPTVVFHAAAHKHVPLLESNPREAVLNNIVGTRVVMDAADHHGTGKFVLISTDKAVNPTSVMGASKRVCEMLLQSRSAHSRTRYAAVRFGNVLGSDGSVIPLFQRQLQRGGPLTVTHPEARRYFMTITEAVRLVLQAGAMGGAGEVFLLDMGEQVRIADLARQLIRMAGLREGEDIEIVYTGLRPGEKLFEELYSDAERMRLTRHERILAWELEARQEDVLRGEVVDLEALARQGDPETIRRALHRLVPDYVEPATVPMPEAAPPETTLVELPAGAAEPAPRRRRWAGRARALADALVAAALLAVTSPLWVLAWLEARIRRQPLLVCERRVGRSRRQFDRRRGPQTVEIDRRFVDRRTRDLLGEAVECCWFRNDLGPVTRWIARRRLSGVPLLLSVLRGELALVGPAPEPEEAVLRWQGALPEYERRFSVRPGVTGLAQVSGYHGVQPAAMARRVMYDLYYVENRSLLLDVRTIARAIELRLGARPASRRPALSVVSGSNGNGADATGGIPAPPTAEGVAR